MIILLIGLVGAVEYSLVDRTGNGFNASNFGCLLNSSSFYFCSADDYMTVSGAVTGYNAGAAINGSLSIWSMFNSTSTINGFPTLDSNAGYIMADNTSATNLFCRYYNPSGVIIHTCTIDGVGFGNVGSNTTNAPNVWHNLITTWNATHVCMYWDGTLDACNAGTFTGIDPANRHLRIANNGALTRDFDGFIDGFQSWSIMLSVADVLVVNGSGHNGNSSVQSVFMINYLDFNDSTSPPNVSSASIIPVAPIVGQDLTCVNGSVSGSPTLHYDWFINGVSSGVDNMVLGSGNLSLYDVVYCSIFGNNSFGNSSVVNSSKVGVGSVSVLYQSVPNSSGYNWTGCEVGAVSIYENYTKPLGVLGASWYLVGDFDGRISFSIPDSCWSYDSSNVQLYVSITGGESQSFIYCRNSTGWNLLNDNNGMLCKDSFWWNIISTTTSSINLSSNNVYGYCNGTSDVSTFFDYNWYLNNVLNSSGSVNVSTPNSLMLVSSIDNVLKGQSWILECRASTSSFNSTPINSSVFSVPNTVPAVLNVSISHASTFVSNYFEDAFVTSLSGNLSDGDWSTKDVWDLISSIQYFNYSKPIGVNAAWWQVKDEMSGFDNNRTYNLSIPQSCFDYSVISLWTSLGGGGTLSKYCFNGTDDVLLVQDSYDVLFEEGMFFNYSAQHFTLSGVCSAFDYDNDNLTFFDSWYFNGLLNKSFNTTPSIGVLSSVYGNSGAWYLGVAPFTKDRINETFDGNWSTDDLACNSTAFDYGFLFFNYTKPSTYGAEDFAVWQVKYDYRCQPHNTETNISNFTLPNSCFAQDVVQTKFLEKNWCNPSSVASNEIIFSCFNGSDWLTLSNVTQSCAVAFYEQNIFLVQNSSVDTLVTNFMGNWTLGCYVNDGSNNSLSSNFTLLLEDNAPVYLSNSSNRVNFFTNQNLTLSVSVSDENNLTNSSCSFELFKSNQDFGSGVGVAFNFSGSSVFNNTVSVNFPESFFTAGTLFWSNVYCSDIFGNSMSKFLNVSFIVSDTSSPGGGGGAPPSSSGSVSTTILVVGSNTSGFTVSTSEGSVAPDIFVSIGGSRTLYFDVQSVSGFPLNISLRCDGVYCSNVVFSKSSFTLGSNVKETIAVKMSAPSGAINGDVFSFDSVFTSGLDSGRIVTKITISPLSKFLSNYTDFSLRIFGVPKVILYIIISGLVAIILSAFKVDATLSILAFIVSFGLCGFII